MAAPSGTHLQPQHLGLRLEDAEFKVILGYKRPRYRRGNLSQDTYGCCYAADVHGLRNLHLSFLLTGENDRRKNYFNTSKYAVEGIK